MDNNKGQALVEFIIILPIFIILIMVIIDFGKIMYNKSYLESEVNDVINMYNNDTDNDEIVDRIKKDDNKVVFDVLSENEYVKVKLSKKIDIITPGLNRILGNPYNISVERVFYAK